MQRSKCHQALVSLLMEAGVPLRAINTGIKTKGVIYMAKPNYSFEKRQKEIAKKKKKAEKLQRKTGKVPEIDTKDPRSAR